MKRTLIGIAAALLMVPGAGLAAEAEGQIQSIDKEQLTITLNDGKSYKLPGEFDLDALKEGMDVILAYDQVGGENLITDMQLSE
jgi:Cu/Ag efflux protein CusF